MRLRIGKKKLHTFIEQAPALFQHQYEAAFCESVDLAKPERCLLRSKTSDFLYKPYYYAKFG